MKSGHEGLIRHSFFLLVVTQVANVANLLFQIVMTRAMPPSEYAVLYTMLLVMIFISMPLEALRTSSAHFTAHAVRAGQLGSVKGYIFEWSKILLWVALAVGAIGVVGSPLIAKYIHLTTLTPIILTALVTMGLIYIPLLAGVLQGAQLFLWMALSLHGMSILRLVSGAILVWWVSSKASAGIVAQACGVLVALILGYWGLFRWLKNTDSVAPAKGAGLYFFKSLSMLAGFAVLMNTDMLWIKHYLPGDADRFASIGLIGRSIIFLPMPIAMAMFPKIIAGGGERDHSRGLLIKALAMVIAIIGSGLVACLLLSKYLFWLIHADTSVESVSLLRMFVWTMAPLSVTYLLINFEMAQHRFQTTWFIVGCAALYLVGVFVWHENIRQIVTVLAVVSSLSMIGMTISLFRHSRRL